MLVDSRETSTVAQVYQTPIMDIYQQTRLPWKTLSLCATTPQATSSFCSPWSACCTSILSASIITHAHKPSSGCFYPYLLQVLGCNLPAILYGRRDGVSFKVSQLSLWLVRCPRRRYHHDIWRQNSNVTLWKMHNFRLGFSAVFFIVYFLWR